MGDRRISRAHPQQIDPSARIAASTTIRGAGVLRVGPYVTVEDNVLIDLGDSPSAIVNLKARCKIKHGAVLRTYDGSISIGARSSIGEYSVLAGHGGLRIGDAVIVAGHCYISASDHIFSSEVPVRFQGETADGVAIDDGVWLGAGVIVLDGVRIARGAVVGAGSVVTRDLARETISVGCPAKFIRARFD